MGGGFEKNCAGKDECRKDANCFGEETVRIAENSMGKT